MERMPDYGIASSHRPQDTCPRAARRTYKALAELGPGQRVGTARYNYIDLSSMPGRNRQPEHWSERAPRKRPVETFLGLRIETARPATARPSPPSKPILLPDRESP